MTEIYTFSSYLVPNDNNEIEWSYEYRLSWDDYNGNIGTSNHDANSAISIKYKDFVWGEKNGTCRVIATFNRKKSWSKSKKSDLLLSHEQGHFDINEIYARKIRKKIACSKFRDRTLTKVFQDIYNSIELELSEFNELYDKETNFGKNEENQKEWQDKINQILFKYDKYKDSIVKIRIK